MHWRTITPQRTDNALWPCIYLRAVCVLCGGRAPASCVYHDLPYRHCSTLGINTIDKMQQFYYLADMEANTELIPLKETARLSGFSRQGLWARIQTGKLAATRPGNEWLVHWTDVLALKG